MGPPSIESPLARVEGEEPSTGNQFLASLLDATKIDAEDLGNPGRFNPPSIQASTGFQVKSADQMSEDGSDECGSGAAGEEPESSTGDRELARRVGDLVE